MEESESPRRKKQHSKELLQPPKGPGVILLLDDARKQEVSSEPPKTFRMERSSALSRVRSFLPQLKQADSELQQKLKEEHPESFNVETVTDGEAYIQLDLALIPFLPDDLDDQHSSSESSSASSDSDSDSDSHRDWDTGDGKVNPKFPLKLKAGRTQKRRNAGIEELAGER